MPTPTLVADIFQEDSAGLLSEWLAELKARGAAFDHRLGESELKEQVAELLTLLGPAIAAGSDVGAEAWRPVREFLARIAVARHASFSSSETALRPRAESPAFARARRDATTRDARGSDVAIRSIAAGLAHVATTRRAEYVIRRPPEEMLELSTPFVKLW